MNTPIHRLFAALLVLSASPAVHGIDFPKIPILIPKNAEKWIPKIPPVTTPPVTNAPTNNAQSALLESLNGSNNRIAALKKEMETKYFDLHKETVARVQGLFDPAVQSYRSSLERIRNSLPELQVVTNKLSEVIQAAVPTTASSLDAAVVEISKISVDSQGRLSAAFDDEVRLLANELAGDQQVAYIHTCQYFTSNMKSVRSEWRTFGPKASALLKEADKKKAEINSELIKSQGEVLLHLSVNIGLTKLILKQGNVEERLLAAFGVTAAGQAPQVVRTWIENGRFYKGLEGIQHRFDESFARFGQMLDQSEKQSAKNAETLKDIAQVTNSEFVRQEAEKAIAYLREPISPSAEPATQPIPEQTLNLAINK